MNANQVKVIGVVGLKIGKAIVIEGVKAVMLNAAASTITSSFEDGLDGVKKLKLKEYLHGRKPVGGKLFGRKNRKKEGFKATILNADGSKVADVDIDMDDITNINMEDVKVAE